MFFESMHASWKTRLAHLEQKLGEIESEVLKDSNLTPEPSQVMRAFQSRFDDVKVLLMGQDPYPTKNHATGLAFAVSEGLPLPKSLKNLMTELADDIPGTRNLGNLANWENRGVMLLNSALSTRVGEPKAHEKIWGDFTSQAVVDLDRSSLVVLALGNSARDKARHFQNATVIAAVHPSPLSASRGFFGSKIYSRVNQALEKAGQEPIDWSC
jgi:uracil-DNA glycosylase